MVMFAQVANPPGKSIGNALRGCALVAAASSFRMIEEQRSCRPALHKAADEA
jgi:hypothetical protein